MSVTVLIISVRMWVGVRVGVSIGMGMDMTVIMTAIMTALMTVVSCLAVDYSSCCVAGVCSTSMTRLVMR
jgi:hypothetical protein